MNTADETPESLAQGMLGQPLASVRPTDVCSLTCSITNW